MTQTRPLKTNIFNRNADLLHGPIFKNLFLFMLPILVSNLFQQLYNTVDTMIVGNVLGDTALAAIGSCGSIYELLVGFGIGIGNGLSIVAARSYGAQDEDLLKRTVAGSLVIGLCASFVITTAGFFGLRPLLQLLDTPAEILEDAYRYIIVIDLGVLVMFLYNLCAGLLRAIGNSVMPLVFLLISSGLNVALDLWFIAGLGMGVQGAAVATVIGQLVTAALAVWYLLHMKIIRPEKGDYRLKGSICGRTLTLGMTSFLSQISLVAAMAAINNMIRKYGALDAVFGQEQYAQIPMAVVGIVMKFFQIVISIVVGMAAGCIPVVGFNMGAKKPARVKELFTKLLLAEATVGAVALVLVELLPRQLIALFGAANESVYYTDFAVKSFRIYLCMIILACVNKACFIFLQAMGKAAESTALSMVREVVFGVGFALLLPRFFGLDGVLYSMPMSDILTFLIAGYLICKTYRELSTKGEV